MTPHSILRDLCDRYGLSPAHGERLLPLVERALNAPPGVRERILELVEGNLERESKRLAASAAMDPAERLVLSTVAKVVHNWSPPDWLMRWCGDPEASAEDDGEAGADEGELERDAG